MNMHSGPLSASGNGNGSSRPQSRHDSTPQHPDISELLEYRVNTKSVTSAGAVPRLPTGLARGGVYYDFPEAGLVTFVFFAPYKPYVSLVGDFNAWDTRRNPLVTDGRGTWWTTIADPGETRYGYYVAIDDQAHAWVADPYAQEVRWGKKEEVWAFLPGAGDDSYRGKKGPDAHVKGWKTPPLRDLVIYELCVRDFGGEWRGNHPHFGDFNDLLPRLDYLADLGINAVELMPIQAFPGKSSWGYNPVFYFAPAEVYGRPHELKAVIEGCHARGMAVLLDVAFNHAWGHHPYYQIYPPLYSSSGKKLQDWNPFFHHTPPAVNMWGGVDWDHFVPATTRYFQDAVRFWLEEYGVDGFRFDWVCGVDYDTWNPMRADFNPFHGIAAICWAARQAKPDCILIGEHWILEGTHPEKSGACLANTTEMDACWSGEFHHGLEQVIKQGWQWEYTDIHRTLGGFRERGYTSATQAINFSCSHDEVRPEHEVVYYAWRHISAPAGISAREAGMRKGMLGLVAAITAPGVPMLYAGQEFAEDTPRTIDFLPLTWSKLELPRNQTHFQSLRRLIHAYHGFAGLRSDHIEFLANHFAQEKVVRYRRWEEGSPSVYVALNFNGAPAEVHLPVNAGRWRELLRDVTIEVGADGIQLELGPWEGAVLVPPSEAEQGGETPVAVTFVNKVTKRQSGADI